MRLTRFFLAAVLPALAAGCDLKTEEEVKVLLPAPPVSWQIAFPRLGFKLMTLDARNAAREKKVADWRSPISLACVRSVNAPILAFPLKSGLVDSDVSPPEDLRPAGGFYPLSLRSFRNEDVLELTWEDGAAAHVMFRVAADGQSDISLFNVERLRRFLREHADPWTLDLDSVAQKILHDEFTAWDIDRLPCRDAVVEPGPGTWFLESPFSPSFEAADGRVTLSGVSLGYHRLHSLGGRSWKMQVGNQETVLVPVP